MITEWTIPILGGRSIRGARPEAVATLGVSRVVRSRVLMRVARALVQCPKSEISLSQNPSLTSQRVSGILFRGDMPPDPLRSAGFSLRAWRALRSTATFGLNRANRVHPTPARRSVSPGSPLTPAGPTWQVTALRVPLNRFGNIRKQRMTVRSRSESRLFCTPHSNPWHSLQSCRSRIQVRWRFPHGIAAGS